MPVAETETSSPAIDIRRVDEQANGLTMSWTDGHQSFFHFIWLRDCCYCDDCGDSYSSNRYLVPSDVALDVRPMSVETCGDGALTISWAPDGHRSRYGAGWLRQHCYDEQSRRERRHDPILWDAHIMASLPAVDYDAALNSDSGRIDLYRKLRDYGFVIVQNGPAEPGSVETVANMVGDLGDSAYSKIFDLSPKSQIRTLGNSTRPVPPHTDEAFRFSPPGLNVLGCVRPADDGGDTILVDGFNLAETMRKEDPDSFALLASRSHTFHRLHEGEIDQAARVHMFALDDTQGIAGIRIHTRASAPMDLPADLIEPFYAAHHKLSQSMMSPSEQACIALKSGDAAIFDNHRVLHARTNFTDPNRHMQICNVSREDFHERLRILARKMGFLDEARQVLAAGMAR